MKLATLTGAGALLLLSLSPTQAHAESFATCSGYITTVPAVITAQGTWCLSKDLASTMQNGNLIQVNVNNVNIDCNGYKIGGLAAGKGTQTVGISATNRLNVSVRNCAIRGFRTAIDMTGVNSSGNVIENNRLDNNTQIGANIEGSGSRVRGNTINDTGGTTISNFSRALQVGADVDVLDNLIDGVLPGNGPGELTDQSAIGVFLYSTGAVLRDNRIRNVDAGEGGKAYGILVTGDGLNRAANNDLFGMGVANSWGSFCTYAKSLSLSDNYLGNWNVATIGCANDGNNVTH